MSPCRSPSARTQGMQSLETASMAFEIFTTYKPPSPGPVSFQTQLTPFSMVTLTPHGQS